MENLEEKFHIYPQVVWELDPIQVSGWILDIGGGGEGVIGQLMGEQVIAIDYQESELLEAEEGPLKIVMDARELKFLDESFQTATAFFSFMYLKDQADQEKAILEVARVLETGGLFHIWDLDLAEVPETSKEFYLVYLQYTIAGKTTDTGYGMRWPNNPRGLKDYLNMAESAGFRKRESTTNGPAFYLQLEKA